MYMITRSEAGGEGERRKAKRMFAMRTRVE
jgi:hypothetical protein